MQRDKIDALLGFAVKAGKIIYGIDTIESTAKRFYSICICHTTADNTKRKTEAVANAKKVPLILSQHKLEDVLYRKNCKVIAITDKQMSEAMIAALGENYRLFNSEVK